MGTRFTVQAIRQCVIYKPAPSCGVYGWNADVFILDMDTVVVAGYRPFGSVKVDTEKLREILSKQGD